MNAKHGKNKKSLLLEALEDRRMLSVGSVNWSNFSKIIGQDQETSNFPTIDGTGQTVAIIDHGIDYTHPDLGGGLGVGPNNRIIYAFDFSSGTATPANTMDYDGHGTGVSGIIGEDPISYAGAYNQGIALGAKQISLKTGDISDPNPEQHIKAALDWVLANYQQYHISVVNLTDFVGSGSSQPIFASELQQLNQLGIFIASPVGNGGAGVPIGYPAANAFDYGVGGIDDNGTFWSNTQTGSALDLLGPAHNVLMTWDNYQAPPGQRQIVVPYATGTSFATAHVSALALLIKQVNPNFTPAQILSIMQDSGVPVTDPNTQVSYKRININDAVALAFQRSGQVVGSGDGTPFGGTALNVAATGTTTIEAENFNAGASGVAYSDPGYGAVFGSTYRAGTSVDVFDSASVSNGHGVGWTKPGEWLKYTVNAGTAGSYALGVQTASVGPGGTFHVELDGTNVTGTLNAPDTGNWLGDQTVNGGTLNLSAGLHTLRLVMDSSQQGNGFMANFDSLKLTSTAALPAPGQVSNPTPANNATLGGSPTLLSWTAATNAQSYDVFLDGSLLGNTTSTQFTLSNTLASGTHTWNVTAKNATANTAGPTWSFAVPVLPPNDGTPFGGTAPAIAAVGTTTIEAENFNAGALGVAYSDPGYGAVFGSTYRAGTSVDVFDSASVSNGHGVGWTKPGEWLKYTVNAGTAGSYALGVQTASVGPGGTFHVELDGTNVTGTLNAPDTGNWLGDQTVNGGTLNLSAGLHTLRLVMDSSQQGNGFMANFDSLKLTSTAALPAPGQVSNPTPANNATLGGSPTLLSWTAATNAQSYDVFLDGSLLGNTTSTQFTLSNTLASGTHTWNVTAKNATANTAGPTWSFAVPVLPPNDGTPFGGTAPAIAAVGTTTIEAENFNAGALGVAYSDPGYGAVFGSTYRAGTSVDVFDSASVSNGHGVGWTKPGEWLKYTVNAGTAGSYALGVQTASVGPGGTFHVELDGTNVTGTLNAPDTGNWLGDQTVNGGTLNLSAGLHTLRLVMDSSQQGNGFMANFDSLKLTSTAALPAPGQVSNPTPANGANLTSAPAVVSWTAATNAQTYDVFLDGTLAGNTSATQFTVNRTLLAGAHTWTVTAKNSTANTAGPTWTYNIAAVAVPTNVNITKMAGNQFEASVAVNPTNSQNMVSVSATDTSNGGVILVNRSTDGGATWTTGSITSAQDGVNANNPRNDPNCTFDSFGNLYVTYQVATSASQIVALVARSSDGGTSFSVVSAATSSSLDYPVIAAGVDSTNSARQAIYVAYTDYSTNRIRLVQAFATGLGQWTAFSGTTTVNNTFGTTASVAVGPNGQVAVAWQDTDNGSGPSNIYVDTTTTPISGGWGNDVLVTPIGVGGIQPVPAEPTRGIFSSVNVAFDNSNSANRGRLYMSYVDAATANNNNSNIEFRYSDTSGASWTAAKQINDDSTSNSQFLSTLAVDRLTGNVAIDWYDARNSVNNNTAQVYVAASTDHGATFSPNMRISAGTSDSSKAQYVVPAVGVLDLGDYIGLAFTGNKLVATWTDNSNSTGDNPNGATDMDIYAAVFNLPT